MTPINDANLARLPAALAARSSAFMAQACVYHDRDYAPNTNVMQEQVAITPVKELSERVVWARARLGISQEQLAAKAGVSQGTIGNIESGIRKKPRELVSIANALGVRPEWLSSGLRPIDALPTKFDDPLALAHAMNESRNYSDPPSLQWGDLMGANLNQPFELAVVDDALADEIRAGCIARFHPSGSREPVPGRPVLVRDKDGNFYLRDYQAGQGSTWQAVPRARGYASLDSEVHGLELIAVMKGFDWP